MELTRRNILDLPSKKFLEGLNFKNGMIKKNIKYIAFDDRWLVLIGIPILTFLTPFIFFGRDLEGVRNTAHQEYFEGLFFTTVYWLYSRALFIWLRKKYDAFEMSLKRLLIQFAIVLFTLPFISILLGLTTVAYYKITGGEDLYEPTFLQGMAATYFLTFIVTLFYEVIYFFHKYKEAILEKEKIQLAHIQGQLENLRNQINPHFLFNSLNTLMNLIPSDPNRAMNYLNKLSRFYRYTVSNQEQQLVPLSTELENVKIYADLLKERFHDGIDISVSEDTINGAQILPLCLQLLIENAVKHNIVSTKKPLKIEVSKEGEYIYVRNNIQKRIREVSSTGMGLKNIRNRIAFFTDIPLTVNEKESTFEVTVPLIHSKYKA